MYSNRLSLNAASYRTAVSGTSGAICVPVKPSAVMYSQLDYVHGTATKHGQQGVPLNKVRILNTLINQLVSMKKESAASKEDITGMTDDQKDELIKNYQQQIKTALNQASQPQTYGFAGLMPEAGALVSVSA